MADDFEGRGTAPIFENVTEIVEGESPIRFGEGVIENEKNRKNDEKDEENSVWHAKPFAVFAHHSFVIR